jgi:hypothetical protein
MEGMPDRPRDKIISLWVQLNAPNRRDPEINGVGFSTEINLDISASAGSRSPCTGATSTPPPPCENEREMETLRICTQGMGPVSLISRCLRDMLTSSRHTFDKLMI